MKSYKDLDVYKISLELFYVIHPASLKLPKHELYELGSQIRRSSDSVVANIVEGYGRRRYKADFIKFFNLFTFKLFRDYKSLRKNNQIISKLF